MSEQDESVRQSNVADDSQDNRVTQTGQGPNFYNNVVLDRDALKPFAWLFGTILVLALLFSVAALVVSTVGAVSFTKDGQRLSEQAVESDREARLMSYWAQRAEVACINAGAKVPPAPQFPTRNQKR
jgi:hypothetical protein